MASLISEVVKDTIREATLNKITLTPENYAQVFCEQAAKRGLSAPECQKVKSYISRLDPATQKDLSKMPVRTEAELFAFLSARLARVGNESGVKLTPNLWGLCKNVLLSVKLLRNKEAKELANTTIGALDGKLNEINIGLLKDKWIQFHNAFDDSYVDDLKKFGIQNSDDLKSIVNALTSANVEISGSKDYYLIAELVLAALLPSISSGLGSELETLSKRLRDMPELIENDNVHNDIRNLIDKRIHEDRKELKNKIQGLDNILSDIENELNNYSKKLGFEHSDKLVDIRKDLEQLNGGSLDEFKTVKSKLESVASSITTSLKDFEDELSKSKNAIKSLKDQIKDLQDQLEKSMQEATNDFLTGLYTKRALDTHLESIDNDYIEKDIDYCVCFFDIDHFKRVNDTYGHSAGDVILAKVGSILASHARQIDVVGRFGGEEFVALLPLCNIEEAHEYAKKILSAISAFEFVYKSTKFSITISCGICARSQTKSYKSCLDAADSMLYAAKEAGRNCIKVYENS